MKVSLYDILPKWIGIENASECHKMITVQNLYPIDTKNKMSVVRGVGVTNHASRWIFVVNRASERIVFFFTNHASDKRSKYIANRPFARFGHMVQNKNYAGMQIKQWDIQNNGTFTSSALLVHCIICVPVWVIPYHVTGSCKWPTLLSQP